MGVSILGLVGAAACSSGTGGGGGYPDGGGATAGAGNFGGVGNYGGGGFGGSGNAAGFAGTGANGGFAGTGATGGFAGTGATGGFAGTGATGGFAGTGATGGFAGTGATGGGQSCDDPTDCGSPSVMVCDPVTQQCSSAQCSDTLNCATGKTCVIQSSNATIGACYPECVYGGAPCANGATCKVSTDGTSGFCWGAGTAFEGQSCQQTPLNTGCSKGLVCATDQSQSVCRKQCSFWSGNPGCNSGQNCAINGVCFAEAGDPASLSAFCGSSSTAGVPCGSDGLAWRGVCQDVGSGLQCVKPCRGGISGDCDSGTTCSATNAGELGVCY